MPDCSGPKQGDKTYRLSAALRENLKRRKAQAKGRKAGTEAGRAPAAGGLGSAGAHAPHDSAGFDDDK